jgi:uncharacterized protein YkvS
VILAGTFAIYIVVDGRAVESRYLPADAYIGNAVELKDEIIGALEDPK